jgi:hypothetical protein
MPSARNILKIKASRTEKAVLEAALPANDDDVHSIL